MAHKKPSAGVICPDCDCVHLRGPTDDGCYQCLNCGMWFHPEEKYHKDYDPVQRQEINLADMAYRADLMGGSDYDPPDPDEGEWHGR